MAKTDAKNLKMSGVRVPACDTDQCETFRACAKIFGLVLFALSLDPIPSASTPSSSKYFGTLKCCHPQISDLVIRLVFFRESSRKIINKLTSRLPSCESSIPGRFALFECNSNDVRICNKISQESCHQEIMKPKSDIWGWQHLWGPKDLLNSAQRNWKLYPAETGRRSALRHT